jgi:hypothetical protein
MTTETLHDILFNAKYRTLVEHNGFRGFSYTNTFHYVEHDYCRFIIDTCACIIYKIKYDNTISSSQSYRSNDSAIDLSGFSIFTILAYCATKYKAYFQ